MQLPAMGAYPQPQSVLIMDNCSIHDKPAIHSTLNYFGAQARFLPPYSPIYNPIEKVFGRVKQWLQTENLHCSRIPAAHALREAFASITLAVCTAFIQGVECYNN